MALGLSQRLVVLLCVLGLSACSPGASANPLRPPLTSVGNIQLPKETSHPAFDLLTLDPRNGRLYIAHSSTGALDVVDARARKLVGHVAGVTEIKAVALTKDPNVVYASEASGNVAIIDVAALKVTKTLDLGGSPDAIGYDPVHDLVVVAIADANEVAFIDATAQSVVGTLALPGAPELMAVDQQSGNIYLAIHDRNSVVLIDTATRWITQTLKGCDINAPTGVAYDRERGLLFVASSGALSIIDVLLWKCRGVADIGHGTDQIAVNPHTHHVYTADGGSRQVSVIDTVSLKPLGVNGTGPEASTLAVDPTTDMVYVMVGRAGIVAVYHDP
jgi:DNA-binding beta-propeller fold protein YncE